VDTREPLPAGLGAAGKRFWERITSKYVLTEAELAHLEEAAALKDELARLRRATAKLVTAELIVEGSTGQTRTHPLFDQLCRCRASFVTLMQQLELPAEKMLGPRGVDDGRATRAS
jgi:hypothetical protein